MLIAFVTQITRDVGLSVWLLVSQFWKAVYLSLRNDIIREYLLPKDGYIVSTSVCWLRHSNGKLGTPTAHWTRKCVQQIHEQTYMLRVYKESIADIFLGISGFWVFNAFWGWFCRAVLRAMCCEKAFVFHLFKSLTLIFKLNTVVK